MHQDRCITCGKPLVGSLAVTCHRCGCSFHQTGASEDDPGCGILYGMEEMMAFIFLCRRCYDYLVRYRMEG